MYVVSSSVRITLIFPRVCWRWGIKRRKCRVVENGDFRWVRALLTSEPLEIRPLFIW